MQAASKRSVFTTIALLPAFMLLCHLFMFFWFRARGGYRPVELAGGDPKLSDPAHGTHQLQPRRSGRVRCSAW